MKDYKKITRSEIMNSTSVKDLNALLDVSEININTYSALYNELKIQEKDIEAQIVMNDLLLLFASVLSTIDIGMSYINKKILLSIVSNPFTTIRNISEIYSNIRLILQLIVPIKARYKYLQNNIFEVFKKFLDFAEQIKHKVTQNGKE